MSKAMAYLLNSSLVVQAYRKSRPPGIIAQQKQEWNDIQTIFLSIYIIKIKIHSSCA